MIGKIRARLVLFALAAMLALVIAPQASATIFYNSDDGSAVGSLNSDGGAVNPFFIRAGASDGMLVRGGELYGHADTTPPEIWKAPLSTQVNQVVNTRKSHSYDESSGGKHRWKEYISSSEFEGSDARITQYKMPAGHGGNSIVHRGCFYGVKSSSCGAHMSCRGSPGDVSEHLLVV